MSPVVNIAAYHFAPLSDLLPLKRELARLCHELGLKGTILLSTEGINLFVAGGRDAIDRLLERLRRVPGLDALAAKESISDDQPFNRMLVKIKREIIAFGIEGIAPGRYTSPRISAEELKTWLDEGRPLTLLDTRNDFEIASGTFDHALAIGIDDFRDFPAAVARLPEELKEQTVVTFCTGGIRCEKAAPYLESVGFKNVLQLDGGILKYFERVGGAHYRGDCFVFDKRVALSPGLQPSGVVQCFVCQSVLTPVEARSERYIEGVSCPKCWKSPDESMADLLQRRHAALRLAASPLPGSVPYDNVRPISVPLRLDGLEVLDFFDAMHTHLSREEWKEACVAGQITCRGETVRPGRIVRSGDRLLHTLPATREPDVDVDTRILYEDDAIVVVDKPAPLPMHPCGRFNRNTLSFLLDLIYRPIHLRPVHRLDADTSGLVVFAKTAAVARAMQLQFQRGTVLKRYTALVRGSPATDLFECALPLATEAAHHGTSTVDEDGAACLTRFRVLMRHADGTTTLEAQPVTGRTHQIRAHLAAMGMPIVGERYYGSSGTDPAAEEAFTGALGQEGLRLLATSIELDHPTSGQRLSFESSRIGHCLR